MGLDRKDLEMMSVSIPTVDWWDIREDIDSLTDTVERLERVVEALALVWKEERTKSWEMILQRMLSKEFRSPRLSRPLEDRHEDDDRF